MNISYFIGLKCYNYNFGMWKSFHGDGCLDQIQFTSFELSNLHIFLRSVFLL